LKVSLLYRIAGVLLALFAAAHTLGFTQSDPSWNVGSLVGSMKSIHFDVLGFNRTYWDFFVAAGYSVGVFYLFAALLAWQLGSGSGEVLAKMGVVRWAFALCFVAIAGLSWCYLFIIPIVFSTAVAACLTAAAWSSTKQL